MAKKDYTLYTTVTVSGFKDDIFNHNICVFSQILL